MLTTEQVDTIGLAVEMLAHFWREYAEEGSGATFHLGDLVVKIGPEKRLFP